MLMMQLNLQSLLGHPAVHGVDLADGATVALAGLDRKVYAEGLVLEVQDADLVDPGPVRSVVLDHDLILDHGHGHAVSKGVVLIVEVSAVEVGSTTDHMAIVLCTVEDIVAAVDFVIFEMEEDVVVLGTIVLSVTTDSVEDFNDHLVAALVNLPTAFR